MGARRRIGNRRGQGLTEYIIIVALVAIAAIGVVYIFGNQLRNQFSTIIHAMAGRSLTVDTSVTGKLSAQTNQRTLADYASKNTDGKSR
jgi:pilus assembly protein Flp/PilA